MNVADELQTAISGVFDIPWRKWDRNDADSAEARSARAYNHALAQARELLAPYRVELP